ncbi:MAG: hypothetical protein V4647_04230 [Pseudomonadota bacterium]
MIGEGGSCRWSPMERAGELGQIARSVRASPHDSYLLLLFFVFALATTAFLMMGPEV